MTTIVAFVAVLGILILIHEWGHFIVARLSGVGVERFSIGFGPVLWRIRGKETEYCISLIPMGGYVKMVGDDENPLEGGRTGNTDPARSFNLKPIWIRFLIVFAGPGMNFVLAVVLASLAFMIWGRPVVPSVVGRVAEGSVAAQAGLKPGDKIVAVDGKPVQYWDEVQGLVQDSRGKKLVLVITGADGERKIEVAPQRVAGRDILVTSRTTGTSALVRPPPTRRRSGRSYRPDRPPPPASSPATSWSPCRASPPRRGTISRMRSASGRASRPSSESSGGTPR
jgi:regulator of sigma E protease